MCKWVKAYARLSLTLSLVPPHLSLALALALSFFVCLSLSPRASPVQSGGMNAQQIESTCQRAQLESPWHVVSAGYLNAASAAQRDDAKTAFREHFKAVQNFRKVRAN